MLLLNKRILNVSFISYFVGQFSGTGQRIKYGIGAGQLQKAVGSANVASIHHAYSDAGLIGAAIKCDASSAAEVGNIESFNQ